VVVESGRPDTETSRGPIGTIGAETRKAKRRPGSAEVTVTARRHARPVHPVGVGAARDPARAGRHLVVVPGAGHSVARQGGKGLTALREFLLR
jgi:hypothetical protein